MVRTILGIASLMLMWTLCGSIHAQAKDAALPRAGWPRDVTGVGETDDKAKANAVREAVKEVTVLLKRQDPAVQTSIVTEEYVLAHVVDEGRPGKEIRNEALDKPFKAWVLTYRTDNHWWSDVVRHSRAEERQTLTSRVMLGLALVLLAGFGYVQLDDYTQRRYTAWLRLAGVGVATTAAAAGWWWMFSP